MLIVYVILRAQQFSVNLLRRMLLLIIVIKVTIKLLKQGADISATWLKYRKHHKATSQLMQIRLSAIKF